MPPSILYSNVPTVVLATTSMVPPTGFGQPGCVTMDSLTEGAGGAAMIVTVLPVVVQRVLTLLTTILYVPTLNPLNVGKA